MSKSQTFSMSGLTAYDTRLCAGRTQRLALACRCLFGRPDQHRGWFHSPFESRDRGSHLYKMAPMASPHEKGRKMSKLRAMRSTRLKSLTNQSRDYPALDRCRDYSEDQRIGPEIIKANTDAYRKMRTPPPLGNLSGSMIQRNVICKICRNLNVICCTAWVRSAKWFVLAMKILTSDVYQTLFNFMT